GSGRISSNPAGITNCIGSCTRKYTEGQSITLTATPISGYRFERWSNDCSGTQPTTMVTISQQKTCTAIFTSSWARWPMPNPPITGLPNPQSYETSTPGIVLDKLTGLMWERTVDANSYT